MTQTELIRIMSETEDERDARELRRIEHHRAFGTATWDDERKRHEIKRRMADRSFWEREAAIRGASPPSKSVSSPSPIPTREPT